MALVKIGNLKGPKGDDGDVGTFASASAETVAPGAPAEAIIGGTPEASTVHFRIPRGPQGLPGVNAVPADEAVAAYIATGGESASKHAVVDRVREQLPFVNVRSMGAVGDGSTDDGPAIQASVDLVAQQGGGIVHLDGARTYRTHQTIHLKSGVTLSGDGATTLDFSTVDKGTAASRYGIRATGTVGAQVALTSAAVRGGVFAQVDSTAGLSVGDWVVLGTEGSNFYPYGGTSTVDRGEIKQIAAVTPTSVAFDDVIYDRYDPSDSAFIAPIDMVRNVSVTGLRILGSGVANERERAIQFDYVDGFRVHECDFDGIDVYCVQLNSAIRGEVTHNRMTGAHYDGEIGGIFYAVSVMNASQWVRVADNHAEQVRHLWTSSANNGGAGFWGYPRFVTVVGNVARNMMVRGGGRSWAFEHHGFGDAILVSNNVADGCYGGFVTRGPGVTFEGNIVRNWFQYALEVHSQTVDARNIIIRNNQVSDRMVYGSAVNPTAIKIDLSAATTVRNVVVEGNVVEVDTTSSTVAGGLHAYGSHEGGLTIRGNRFTWVSAAAAGSWLVRTLAKAIVIERNEIIGAAFGIRATGDESDVCDNYGYLPSQASSGNLVYIDGVRSVASGNRARRFLRCISSSSAATELSMVGNTGIGSSDPFRLGSSSGLQAKANVWQGGITAINN